MATVEQAIKEFNGPAPGDNEYAGWVFTLGKKRTYLIETPDMVLPELAASFDAAEIERGHLALLEDEVVLTLVDDSLYFSQTVRGLIDEGHHRGTIYEEVYVVNAMSR